MQLDRTRFEKRLTKRKQNGAKATEGNNSITAANENNVTEEFLSICELRGKTVWHSARKWHNKQQIGHDSIGQVEMSWCMLVAPPCHAMSLLNTQLPPHYYDHRSWQSLSLWIFCSSTPLQMTGDLSSSFHIHPVFAWDKKIWVRHTLALVLVSVLRTDKSEGSVSCWIGDIFPGWRMQVSLCSAGDLWEELPMLMILCGWLTARCSCLRLPSICRSWYECLHSVNVRLSCHLLMCVLHCRTEGVRALPPARVVWWPPSLHKRQPLFDSAVSSGTERLGPDHLDTWNKCARTQTHIFVWQGWIWIMSSNHQRQTQMTTYVVFLITSEIQTQ